METGAMKTIRADEIQPGDVLVSSGHERRITVDRQCGWSWPIAADDCGWALALGDHLIDVRRIAACFTPLAEATRTGMSRTREITAVL